MRISTFFYTIKQGIVNIWKNKLFSLASIATMTACIFLFGLFYMIVVNFQSMVKDAESGVAVTVLFDEGISDQRIEEIGELISERPEVSHYDFISADEAWESFKEVYFEGNEAAAASFAGDNPLANSASYAIYMNDISMQDSLVTYLKSVDGVREVKQSQQVANTLTDFNSLIGYGRHPDSARCCRLFDQQYDHGRYLRPQGRDCDHEADRSDGLFCARTVCGRRYCNRTDRSGNSAWHSVRIVREDCNVHQR